MVDPEDVCVLIPTLDEAETIGDVIRGFRDRGFRTFLVIDGGSTDGTRDIAADLGARVERQSETGKGQAVREALGFIDAPYVLMLDGDGTYRPEDAETMLEPLFDDRAEHVIGDRFADIEDGAMTRLNQFGNGIINWAFELIHGEGFVDILSGYRAFTLSSVERYLLTADGFGIETQLAVECAKHGHRTEVVPIRYRARPAGSETNLRPFRDGVLIGMTLYGLAKTNNPLFYFGIVGGAATAVGAGIGAYVAAEWFLSGIPHEVLAVVSAFSILFGIQLVMFGILSDMIIGLHREQLRRLD